MCMYIYLIYNHLVLYTIKWKNLFFLSLFLPISSIFSFILHSFYVSSFHFHLSFSLSLTPSFSYLHLASFLSFGNMIKIRPTKTFPFRYIIPNSLYKYIYVCVSIYTTIVSILFISMRWTQNKERENRTERANEQVKERARESEKDRENGKCHVKLSIYNSIWYCFSSSSSPSSSFVYS